MCQYFMCPTAAKGLQVNRKKAEQSNIKHQKKETPPHQQPNRKYSIAAVKSLTLLTIFSISVQYFVV